MSTEKNRGRVETSTKGGILDRRSILFGSTTLAAVSALSAGAPLTVGRAQAEPAPAGRKPNILMVMATSAGST